MRARLYAVLILVLLIGIPGGIYWYFFTENTASLTVRITGAEEFQIELAGTLDNDNLPLADRLLSVKKDCKTECIISPIAPIRYKVTLTSLGKTTITDDISIGVGEDLVRTYNLTDDIIIVPIDIQIIGNIDIGRALITNATKTDTNYTYKLIGVDRDNRVYTERESPVGRDIGILSLEKFESLYRVPKGVGNWIIDITGMYLLAPLFTDKTIVLSLDAKAQKEIPITNVRGYVGGDDEKILTQSGVMIGVSSSYGINPRFTDWLDISSTERLGYIDKLDTQKLSLSGLPAGESVLILLDRTTGQSSIIKRGIDMEFLFFLGDIPVYLDAGGKLWELKIK